MKKRERGRPKGSTKLPVEYWHDLAALGLLAGLVQEARLPKRLPDLHTLLSKAPKLGTAGVCRLILKNGPLRWIDANGKQVKIIDDVEELRVRISEARTHPLALQPGWRPRTTALLNGNKVLHEVGEVASTDYDPDD